MEIKGKITQILPVASGVSKAGKEWKKREFVIEMVDGSYTKQICFTLFNDKISIIDNFQTGENVTVSFSLESREYNGRWYHNVNAWRVEKDGGDIPQDLPPEFTDNDIPPEKDEEETDLPF